MCIRDRLNIIQVADLVLPDKETSFEEYTTMELLSVAMLIVISTFALDFKMCIRDRFPLPPPCTDYGLPTAGASRISLDKTRGKIPVIRPFQERRMRSAAKSGNQSAFLTSFGRPDEPFPTLLAKAVNMISFWYEGEEKDGVLRNLTPVECERLMGLPDGWTA